MRRANELFTPCIKEFQKGVPALYVTHVPAFTVVGWIPYFDDLESLAAAGAYAYTNHELAERSHFFDGGPSALEVLFWSGNISISGRADNPNPAPGTEDDYAKLVVSKNYRCALSIKDIEMGTSEDGTPVYLSY